METWGVSMFVGTPGGSQQRRAAEVSRALGGCGECDRSFLVVLGRTIADERGRNQPAVAHALDPRRGPPRAHHGPSLATCPTPAVSASAELKAGCRVEAIHRSRASGDRRRILAPEFLIHRSRRRSTPGGPGQGRGHHQLDGAGDSY